MPSAVSRRSRSYRSFTCGCRAWIFPNRRSILLRSFSRPVTMAFSRPLRPVSMLLENISDRLLFFLAARGAAQNVSLLALRYGNLLNLHFGPDSRPVLLQQLRFKLLHLATRRARQILSVAFADRCQILFAYDAAIEHPDPAS